MQKTKREIYAKKMLISTHNLHLICVLVHITGYIMYIFACICMQCHTSCIFLHIFCIFLHIIPYICIFYIIECMPAYSCILDAYVLHIFCIFQYISV